MPTDQPRLLLVLPQLPQDPSSGAARSTTTIAEMLAARGFTVRALAISATEKPMANAPAKAILRNLGIRIDTSHRGEFRYLWRGVEYRILDTGSKKFIQWENTMGRDFDRCFDQELASFEPDFLLTFGGSVGDVSRRKRARKQGVKVVFSLRNEGYLAEGAFDETDAVLTPTRHLADLYKRQIGLESTPIPSPITREDVVSTEHDPIFVTLVNPTIEKGVMFTARLAEELCVKRPDIPILVIESRGSAGMLASAGLNGGFDLRRHENIMVSPAVPAPRDIFTPTRVLLAPSIREAFGRVAVEALLNGIPPLVSNRDGLPEAVKDAGFVLPLPPDLTLETKTPVSPDAVQPWIEVIELLYDDEARYVQERQRALNAAQEYSADSIGQRYLDYFRSC